MTGIQLLNSTQFLCSVRSAQASGSWCFLLIVHTSQVRLPWGERMREAYFTTPDPWKPVRGQDSLYMEVSGLERHLLILAWGVFSGACLEWLQGSHIITLSPWFPRTGVSKIWTLGTNLARYLHLFKFYWNTTIPTSLCFVCGCHNSRVEYCERSYMVYI